MTTKHPLEDIKYNIFTDPAIDKKSFSGALVYCDCAQDTIKKFIKDGDTKAEAIERWQQLTHCSLPEIIKNTIKEK